MPGVRRLQWAIVAPVSYAMRHFRPLCGVGTDIASVQMETSETLIRGRVERTRVGGKLAFMQLRQPPFHSIQVVASGATMAQQVRGITPESIVDVSGAIVRSDRPVKAVSCVNYELHAKSISVVSAAAAPLPFPPQDNNTKLDTRLNHRHIDMRTSLTSAVLRIVSAICQEFRTELLADGFLEIHTPKLLGAASESGSAVFALDYFGRPAYLAQSPQLYKQMALMGDAMRVFEIGPVFRAEKSLTHRHLTEFVGLDAELVIGDHYTEVLDVLERTLCGVFARLHSTHAELIRVARASLASTSSGTKTPSAVVCALDEAAVRRLGLGDDAAGRAPRDPFGGRVGGATSHPRVLRLSFHAASRLLATRALSPSPRAADEDFSLPEERRLGELVRERYGVDMYVVDQFPASGRPFYTMPHPNTEGVSCGFDVYLRGEEICSGAQRLHDATALLERMEAKGVEAAQLKDYVEAFRYGAWPHGGFGLGLERMALFLLGAQDIRQISLFPRDPKRLTP